MREKDETIIILSLDSVSVLFKTKLCPISFFGCLITIMKKKKKTTSSNDRVIHTLLGYAYTDHEILFLAAAIIAIT